VTRWSSVLALAVGCATAPCPSEASGADAALHPDASSLLDAGSADTDTPLPDGCSLLQPVRIVFDQVWLAAGPGDTRTCGLDLRVRVFRHGAVIPVFDSADGPRPFACSRIDVTDLAPGDYDIAIEGLVDDEWLTGGDLVRPDHCGGAGVSAAFCPPLRVLVPPCAERRMMGALYCDPAAGDCPDAAWPWLGPPP
jgi:hypothetical protein